MEGRVRTDRVGGVLLAVSGVGFFLAGALHPQPIGATSFHDAIVSMLSSPRWAAAHWTALVTGVVMAWAISLLVDDGWADGSVGALAGARLATIAALFMSVEWAAEIALSGDATLYARNAPLAMADLVDAMQGVGWPALGIGLALLALFTRGVTPRWVSIAGTIGAVALALAGVLAMPLQVPHAGVLFLGGHLVALWLVWAGLHLARQGRPRIAARRPAVSAEQAGVG